MTAMNKKILVAIVAMMVMAATFAETRRVTHGNTFGLEYVTVSYGKIGNESVSYTVSRDKDNYSFEITFNNGATNKVTYRFVNLVYPFINYVDKSGYEYHSISLKKMFEKAAELEAYSDLSNQDVSDSHVYNLWSMTEALKPYMTLADDGSFVYDGSTESAE